MNYSDITINDPNSIKRFLQKQRFVSAISLFSKSNGAVILDYGAGDGELIFQLSRKYNDLLYICFEPTLYLMGEAQKKLDKNNNVKFVSNIHDIQDETVDTIFCLEVFEHLPFNETIEAILQLDRILKPRGIAIIGVPVEIGIPALYKGIFRLSRRYGEYDANLKNIFLSTLCMPPRNRPKSEITPGMPYYFHHTGFDYRKLVNEFSKHFSIVKNVSSPLNFLGTLFNPEVYFVIQKVAFDIS